MSSRRFGCIEFKKLLKRTFAYSILLLIISGCTPKTQWHESDPPPPTLVSINIIDRNGLSETINNAERLEQYASVDFLQPQPYQKVLRVYNRDFQGNIPSCITSYHANGFPSQYLEVVNSRACGAYKEWHQNGVQKIEATVIGGSADIASGTEKTWLFNGCSQVWDENGKLIASIPYTAGDLEGISIYYHSNGNAWKLVPYHKNKIDGMMEVYHENGTLLERCNYQSGLKEGESLRYWSEELLAAQEVYSDSYLASGRYYNPSGECIAQIDHGQGTRVIFSKESVAEFHEYHNGVLDGEVKVLDKYGRAIRIYHMKNNVKQGEEICFYDAPKFQKELYPKISINWYDGKMQGSVKTWYGNGQQESQKEMNNNKKHGLSTIWYDDGSLMIIEEYNQNKLFKGEYFPKGEKISISEVYEGQGIATIFAPDGTFQRKVAYLNGKPFLED